jgi:hypothetical protein
MKIIELLDGLQLPINNEQADLLARFQNEPRLGRNQLSDREQVLANQLTVQEVLLRKTRNGKTYYRKKIR